MARQCRDGRVIPVRVSRWRRVLVGVLCTAYAAAVLCYWEWSWVQAALLLPRAVGADKGARLERLPCGRAPQPEGVERGVFLAVQPHLQFGG